MSLIEAAIRDQVNRDLDCSGSSTRLMAMRAEVTELIGRWKAAGGGERLPTVSERLSRSFEDRPVAKPKLGKGKDKDKDKDSKPRPGHSGARV